MTSEIEATGATGDFERRGGAVTGKAGAGAGSAEGVTIDEEEFSPRRAKALAGSDGVAEETVAASSADSKACIAVP